MEEKLKETSRKLEAITWDDKARCYHEAVRVCVAAFPQGTDEQPRQRRRE